MHLYSQKLLLVFNKQNIHSILIIFFRVVYQHLGRAHGPPFGLILTQKLS